MTSIYTHAVVPSRTTLQTSFNTNLAQNPVAFGNKATEARKHQSTMQNALQQASMLMTIPVLLGVNGIAYMTGADEPQLIVVSQKGKKIDLIA
ncbi:hypothetical protein [Vampirovibrio sp.]|uniref:hypothetical protein n=1 Tax=Vampirovibrio sp. TaxID=2717857 RepID=UPI0035939B50